MNEGKDSLPTHPVTPLEPLGNVYWGFDLAYKFTSLDGGIKLLENRTLKFSLPSEFNDVNEGRFAWDFDLYLAPESSQSFCIDFINEFDEFRRERQTYYCCFCLRCEFDVMWGHYADKHQGLCFEFDGVIGGQFVDDRHIVSQPIKYSNMLPRVRVDTRLLDLEQISEQVEQAHFCKSLIWEYEREFRLATALKSKDEEPSSIFPVFDPMMLRRVIVGTRVTDSQLSEIESKVDEFNSTHNASVNIAYIVPSKDEYEMEIGRERKGPRSFDHTYHKPEQQVTLVNAPDELSFRLDEIGN